MVFCIYTDTHILDRVIYINVYTLMSLFSQFGLLHMQFGVLNSNQD